MQNLYVVLQGTPNLSLSGVNQRAKKVVSDSPGLVDFAIGLVMFVLNLPDRQVLFFGEIQITDGLLSILLIKKGWPLVHYFRLLLGDRSLHHRHSEPPVQSTHEIMHNIVFKFHKVARTYVGVFDWVVSHAVCDQSNLK